MFEITSERKTRDAYRAAHEARAEFLSGLLAKVFNRSAD